MLLALIGRAETLPPETLDSNIWELLSSAMAGAKFEEQKAAAKSKKTKKPAAALEQARRNRRSEPRRGFDGAADDGSRPPAG